MKNIPKFKSEKDEQEFWDSADSTQYIDWKKGKKLVLSDLKPSLKNIES